MSVGLCSRSFAIHSLLSPPSSPLPHATKPHHAGCLCTPRRSADLQGLHRQRGGIRAESDALAGGISKKEQGRSESLISIPDEELKLGSPIVIIEAPPTLKTAESMPMLRQNLGLIKPGDAGRIIDRKPKNVWAIRFSFGAYLIDRKYFKQLNVS